MDLLKSLAEPLALFVVVVLAAGLVARRRRLGRVVVAGAFVGLYALSTPFVGARLLAALEDGAPLALDEARRAQAIVVLAAGARRAAPEFGAATSDALALERLRYAAFLQRRTGLPLLVSGGRVRPDAPVLAEAMSGDLRRDFGVGARWVEDRSRTTFENAQASSAILARSGISTVLLVTHAWHMPRAAEAFEHFRLRVVRAPTGFTDVGPGWKATDLVANTHALALSARAIHELVGRVWYAIAHYA